jgi:hypothetical protein
MRHVSLALATLIVASAGNTAFAQYDCPGGQRPVPRQLRNEWLSPCAASTLSVGLEICASCATRGTCIRSHLLPTACREVAITSFSDHTNASITRCIAGSLRFFTLIQFGDRPARYGRRLRAGVSVPEPPIPGEHQRREQQQGNNFFRV